MEANLPAAMTLHDYVVHGEGDPREALAELGSWVWHVESFLAMVEWLRAFNAGRPLEDRVAVYGFGAGSTRGAVQRLRDHLAAVDPGFLDDLAAELAIVDDDGPTKAGTDVHEWLTEAERGRDAAGSPRGPPWGPRRGDLRASVDARPTVRHGDRAGPGQNERTRRLRGRRESPRRVPPPDATRGTPRAHDGR